jgi:adenine-specific DNA methylase
MNPVPDEPLPPEETLGFRVQRYGLTHWGDLFNTRQKLAIITFAEKVRQTHSRMRKDGDGLEFTMAVTTYLALILDRLVSYCSNLGYWHVSGEKASPAMQSQRLSMVFDYFESIPIADSFGWSSNEEWMLLVISHCSMTASVEGTVIHGSATELPWPDNHFDAVLTDPPYYDSVPYSDLSDFFYVWLKRTVGELYPELFATPLTPKSQEMVADASKTGGMDEANRRFEEMLTKAFGEVRRVLKPEGSAVIVFAHKTTEAWETVVNGLLNAGLYMTASWPIHTEMQTRLRAQDSAALASSIYMVCRKRATDEVGEFSSVRRQIGERVQQKLAQFWEAGIRGADFFMSAIGPAVEVFGKYSKVERLSGEEVKVPELLVEVRRVVSEFALERILKQAELGGVDVPTRFYLLYRWTYNQTKVHFDEVRKLSQGVGVELSDLWQPGGIVLKEKEYVRVPSPSERAKDASFSRKSEFRTMIDALHRAVAFWERNEQKKLNEHLSQTYGGNEAFWQVAQAIAEVLPEGDKERQLVQGLLYGRKRSSGERQVEMFAKT